MLNFLECTDFYKTDHRRQMEPGTTRILENWTPRAGRNEEDTGAIFFGLQACLKYDLTDLANRTFFSRPKTDVLYEYQSMLDSCLGPTGIGTEHISALHDLQYLPLRYCALPEGTFVPYKIPMFTVENTHEDFAWVAGYLETLVSSRLWLACTSATTALRYRALLRYWCKKTGGDLSFVDWQAHDFSFRGMGSPEAAAMSGAGHLLSFNGTDTIPAIRLLRDAYSGEGQIGGSVPATEHMVMCLGGKETEIETFERLLKLYPAGIVSVVSDTWDLWKVITETLPLLKDKILAREGKLVIRPDSGDPVDILTGNPKALVGSAHKGVIELLWDLFGGSRTYKGYKVLDPHVGAIYGDSITPDRAKEICARLEVKGFASTNVVLGVGSYTYQYATRDVHGFAIKATWAKVGGEERKLFKDPVTDSGMKKSARGRLVVERHPGRLVLIDNLSEEQESWYRASNLLQPVWENGRFLKREILADIRKRVQTL